MSGRLLTPAETARDVLNVGRSTVPRLVRDEGLPCVVLATGPKGRHLLRFDRDEVQKWLEGRRERQLNDWSRHQRRSPA
jgi:excisionase family DNA binding protein